MSDFVPKPRLEYYRALLSFDNPDLEKIIDAFIYWSTFVEYLIFRKENIYAYKKEYKAVKAAKRGNDVYSWRLSKRLKHVYELPKNVFFNYKDRNRKQSTKVVFVTLTYARNEPLDVLWEEVGKDYNRWISALRRRYGKISVLRCWEAQRDGYPHIHCVLLFHGCGFQTFFYNGKWRIFKKREIAELWRWGYSDIFALYSLGAGVGYVLKYVTKVNNALLTEKVDRKLVLSLALMWIFRKRAYSVSKDFGSDLVEEEEKEEVSPHGQVDLEGKSIYKWYLVGFWADIRGRYDSWSVELSYRDFWKICSSKEFTENIFINKKRIGL
ncbi:MAG: rolling circle replication-associated protein [Candidatus Odinarchaeia archaeon]